MHSARDILQQLAAYGTPSSGGRVLELSVGLEAFIKRWKGEILPFVQNGGAELKFIEGPYGRGKTHCLLAMQAAADEMGFATCLVDCGMEHPPFASLSETYRTIAMGLVGSRQEKMGLAAMLKSASRIDLELYRATEKHLVFANTALEYAKRLTSGTGDRELVADLRALIENDKTRPVTFRDLYRTPGIRRPLGRIGKRNAASWLRSLLLLPKRLGYAGLVVLFDETGADLHQGRSGVRRAREHLAHLRQLVDQIATGGLPGVAIVYASTPDFVRNAADEYPALHQRVARVGAYDEYLPPNQRAVWCGLDELTKPSSHTNEFFLLLGQKLIDLGREAGVVSSHLDAVSRLLPTLATRHNTLVQGAVREFVKTLCSHLLCQA
jgi:hypothetical protein